LSVWHFRFISERLWVRVSSWRPAILAKTSLPLREILQISAEILHPTIENKSKHFTSSQVQNIPQCVFLNFDLF